MENGGFIQIRIQREMRSGIGFLPLGPGRAVMLLTNRAETAIKSFISKADYDGLCKARMTLVSDKLVESDIYVCGSLDDIPSIWLGTSRFIVLQTYGNPYTCDRGHCRDLPVIVNICSIPGTAKV